MGGRRGSRGAAGDPAEGEKVVSRWKGSKELWPAEVKVRLQTGPESVLDCLGCHSPVAIVTKKYLWSPPSGPGPGLGVDKDSRDALYGLCCQRAQHLLEVRGTGPSGGMT